MMKMVVRLLILLVFSSTLGQAQPKVKKVELFEVNLYEHRPYKMSLNDVSSNSHFFCEVDGGPVIEAINSFIEVLHNQKAKKGIDSMGITGF